MSETKNIWSNKYQNEEFLEKTRMMIMNNHQKAFVIDKIGIKEGMKVLDVGCGTGAFTYYLAEGTKNVTYVGIDIDENFIDFANKKVDSNNKMSFKLCDARKLDFEDGEFDIIVSQTFLHTVREYTDVIREMRRVCKKGGIVATLNVDLSYSSFDLGVYDIKEYPWIDKYRTIMKDFLLMQSKTTDMKDMTKGINPTRIPYAFHEQGLKNIKVYPISNYFSLSNCDMKREGKIKYLELDYISEVKRIDAFVSANEEIVKEQSFDVNEYKKVLLERKESLINHVDNNNAWESFGVNSTLVVTRPAKGRLIMTDWEYRCKEEDPVKTVENIKFIFDKHGIMTKCVEVPHKDHFDLYSCRVSILAKDGTELVGSNGKGMSKDLSFASGHAELMERVQNRQLRHLIHPHDKKISELKLKESPYFRFDEEIKLPCINEYIDKIVESCNVLLPLEEKKKHVKKLISEGLSFDDKGNFDTQPFYSLRRKRIEYIPDFIRNFTISNGMAAGNSVEEAMVESISEIYERYVTKKLIYETIIPPIVPRKDIEEIPHIIEIINGIEKDKKYECRILDCSLGLGFPVLGLVLINKEKNTCGVRFGSQPNFAIALERLFTEGFQGRSLEQFSMINTIETDRKYVTDWVNSINLMKMGVGCIPKEWLLDTPTYRYEKWKDMKEKSNVELVKYLLNIAYKMKKEVYIRDVSYLGFPSIRVYIPGISEIIDANYINIKIYKLEKEVLKMLSHIDNLNEDEMKKLNTFLRLKKGVFAENSFSYISSYAHNEKFVGSPTLELYFFFGLCHYYFDDWEGVVRSFDTLSKLKILDDKDLKIINAMYKYMIGEHEKIDMKVLYEKIKDEYPEYVDKVFDILSDKKTMLKKVYPVCNKRDCDNCKMTTCHYPEIRDLFAKLVSFENDYVADYSRYNKFSEEEIYA